MSWLSSFLHPEKGYQAAQNQLNNYFGQAQNLYNQGQGYIQPYNQQGQDQAGNLNSYIQSLMDPQALQDKWSSGYKESDYAKNLEDMAQQHGLNAASSMGLMGSTPALQAIQAGTSQIGAADRQQYLNDLMEKYKQGAGLSQNMYGVGANAANQMGQNAMNMGQNTMNMGQNSANMAFGQQNAPGNMLSNVLQGLVSFATPIGQAWGMNKLGVNQPWSLTGGH